MPEAIPDLWTAIYAVGFVVAAAFFWAAATGGPKSGPKVDILQVGWLATIWPVSLLATFILAFMSDTKDQSCPR